MQVLITGVTGFVGGYLAEALSAAYPEACLFGTAFGSHLPAGLPAGLTVLEADLREPDQLREVIAAVRPSHVFHLAGFASAAGTNTAEIRSANVDVARILVELLLETGDPCRVHLASTGYVYGTTQNGRLAREDDALHPVGSYAESKAEMEKVIAPLACARVPITVTRAFNHTGPRQTPAFVIPGFARQLAAIEKGKTEPIVRVGNLEARRDFLDVRDVVQAYRLLLVECEPQPWRVVNVASGEAVSIQHVLDQLLALTRVNVDIVIDPERLRPSDMPACIGDPARLFALTGWRKSIPLTDTLRETLEWWRAQE